MDGYVDSQAWSSFDTNGTILGAMGAQNGAGQICSSPAEVESVCRVDQGAAQAPSTGDGGLFFLSDDRASSPVSRCCNFERIGDIQPWILHYYLNITYCRPSDISAKSCAVQRCGSCRLVVAFNNLNTIILRIPKYRLESPIDLDLNHVAYFCFLI